MGSLVLTRNSGQSVLIGDDIVVRVELRKGSRQVKLTIDAPLDKLILREELIKYKQPEK